MSSGKMLHTGNFVHT